MIPVYILFSDIDECSLETDDCSNLTNCINTDGSYLCQCIAGFTGDGGACTGNKLYHYQGGDSIKLVFFASGANFSFKRVKTKFSLKDFKVERSYLSVESNLHVLMLYIKMKKKMKPWILLDHSCRSLSPVSVA